MDHPVRTISKDATIEHRQPLHGAALKAQYVLLDKPVKAAGELLPVLFDETLHIPAPFETNLQRFRFIESLQLSVPIDIIRFSPGGSI